MNELLLIVIGMALATYLPRLIPLLILGDKKLPRFLGTFLQFVPYAVLGALVFPGILYSTGQISSAVAGAIAAFLLAWMRFNIMLVVLGGIGAAFVWALII